MGSSRPHNSTRARKARSVQSPQKPGGRPPSPESSGRRIDGLSGVSTHRPPRHPRITERRAGSATEALHDLRGIAHEADLRRIRSKLKRAMSTVIVVRYALSGQNVMVDGDAADVLRLNVSDELDRQIECIDILLGEPPRDEHVEDDGGEV